MRFSQNADQRANKKFTYINYDDADRPVETGEFTFGVGSLYTWGTSANDVYGSAGLIAAAGIGGTNEFLTDATATGGTKTDVRKTHYDEADPAGPALNTEFVVGRIAWKERDNGAKSWFSYDEQGRIVSYVQKVPGLTDNKTIDYTYAPNGLVAEVIYEKGNINEYFYHAYTYDADARLQSVSTTSTYDTHGLPTNLSKQADYAYYVHGPLKSVNLANGLQQIDYTYTVQGWLKSINDPNNLGASDVFAEQLDYFTGDYTNKGIVKSVSNTGNDRFDGLPRAQTWITSRPPGASPMVTPEAFLYSYDDRYRLTQAQWGTVSATPAFVPPASTNAYVEAMSYDLNGNITALQRYTRQGGTAKHNFTYNYTDNTNLLTGIASYANYGYNTIGRMTSQTGTINKAYTYNVSGLISSVSNIATGNSIYIYAYDQNNQLIRKDFYDLTTGSFSHSLYYIRDANGNLIASQTGTVNIDYNIFGADILGNFNRTDKYDYLLKDHLGSTRGIVSSSGIIACADYYPYGMKMADNSYNENTLTAQYQGQNARYDDALNINEFYWRQYDPVIARWSCTDPHGQYDSPYISMGNNPVVNTDPDGGSVYSLFVSLTEKFSFVKDKLVKFDEKIDDLNDNIEDFKKRHIEDYGSLLRLELTYKALSEINDRNSVYLYFPVPDRNKPFTLPILYIKDKPGVSKDGGD